MPDISETLRGKIEVLRAHLPEIKEKFHVREMGVFGSYVHGDQTEQSDIDILVEYAETPGLFGFIALEDYLSKLLKIKVDLIIKDGLKQAIKEEVLDSTLYV